jgi:hypothetical protein
MDNPVAKALHDGLDTLREHGLTKGMLVDEATGAVCARGALIHASVRAQSGRYSWTHPRNAALDLLADVAKDQFGDRLDFDAINPHAVVSEVNDHPDTTQEDVERIFEKAIVKAYETL